MANEKIKKVDIGETICEAATILIEKQLERLQFDKTIEAIITDATRASEGIYTVSTGQASFLAYADKDDYKKDEEVMVTIPQGDYDKQKNIISRKIDFNQTEELENYNSAFSTLIDIVNHNEDLKENEKKIKVNEAGEEYSWNTNIANFISSNAFKNAPLIKIDNKNFGENELVGYTRLGVKADFTSFLDSYNVVSGNYGLAFLVKFKHNETNEEILRQCFFDSKDFFGDIYNFIIPQTQEVVFDISEYAEDYHIEYIEVYLYQRGNFINTNGQLIDTSEGEDNDIVLNNLYLTLGIDASEYVKDTVKIYTLNVDTYQKNINIKQIELFSQEELFKIKKVLCSNYIKNCIGRLPDNSDTKRFLSGIKEKLLESLNVINIDDIDNQKQIIENLIYDLYQYWVRNQPDDFDYLNKNYYNDHPIFFQKNGLFCGFNVSIFTLFINMKNEIISILKKDISSEDISPEDIPEDIKTQKVLENNKKIIKLNWIHKDDITGNISRIQDDIPENYEIRWYYYKLGSSSADNFSGASWEHFYGCIETQDQDGYYCITSENEDIATNKVQVDFYPNVGKDTQQLKAIIIKKNIIESFTDGEVPLEEKVAESKIITFTNLDEKNFDSAKIDLNDLSIRFDDDSFGNYFLYNRAGQISKGSDSRLRTLTAVFDEEKHIIKEKKVLSLPYSSVKWTVPASNTMIRPISTLDGTGKVLKKSDMEEAINCEGYYIQYNALTDTFEYILKDNGENPEGYLKTIGYYISNDFKNNYNRNYVQLEVQKNGSTYITKVDMNFGPSGTSGSKYKITIDWDNNKNVFNISNKKEEEEVSGRILLTQDNKTVELEGKSYYSFRWYPVKSEAVEDSPDNNEKFIHVIEENRNYYYPITTFEQDNKIRQKVNNEIQNIPFNCLQISYELDDGSMSNIEFYGQEENSLYPKYWISGQDEEFDINSSDYTQYILTENKGYSILSVNNDNNILTLTSKDNADELIKIVYGKATKKNDNGYILNMPKLIFKKFDKVKNTSYKQKSSSYSGIAVFKKDGTATYYYDSVRRAYVKYNDEYIIDPWADFDPEREYYYPVYADIDYESNLLLDIQDQNTNNTKNKGYFKIVHRKDKNNNNKITSFVTMNDLYMLEVTLNNFGDYNLVASFPIALKNELITSEEGIEKQKYNVNFINGPTQVIYSTTGEISFDSNDPYSIDLSFLDDNGKIFKNISSRLESSNDNINFMTMGHWELIIDTKNKKDIKSSFLPQLITLATPNLETTKALLLSQLKSQEEQELYKILLFLIQYKNKDNYNIIIENINDLTNYFNSFWIQRVLNDGNWSNFNLPSEFESTLESYINNSASEEEIKKFIEQLKKYPKFYKGYSPFYLYGAPYLNPPGVYFKDTSFYGVKYVLDHNIGKDDNNEIIIINKNDSTQNDKIIIPADTILWTQPIIVEQDNYFSTTLNNWNGKDIITDEQTGIISANGFSAGRKEEDNTFTGVVLGDWSKDISSFNPKYTGIFGFDHGAMSYALKDDGTAFFGKDGKGRIYFDGNSSKIYSSQWILPKSQDDGTYKWQEKGMMLDIDDGIIQINDDNRKITIAPNTFKIVAISNSEETDLLNFSKNKSVINVQNFSLNATTTYNYKTYFIKMNTGAPFLQIGRKEAYKEDYTSMDIPYDLDFIKITNTGGAIRSIGYIPERSQPGTNYKYGQTGLEIDLTNNSIKLGSLNPEDPNSGFIVGHQLTYVPAASQSTTNHYFEIRPNGTTFINAKVGGSDGKEKDCFSVTWNGEVKCSSINSEDGKIQGKIMVKDHNKNYHPIYIGKGGSEGIPAPCYITWYGNSNNDLAGGTMGYYVLSAE